MSHQKLHVAYMHICDQVCLWVVTPYNMIFGKNGRTRQLTFVLFTPDKKKYVSLSFWSPTTYIKIIKIGGGHLGYFPCQNWYLMYFNVLEIVQSFAFDYRSKARLGSIILGWESSYVGWSVL